MRQGLFRWYSHYHFLWKADISYNHSTGLKDVLTQFKNMCSKPDFSSQCYILNEKYLVTDELQSFKNYLLDSATR